MDKTMLFSYARLYIYNNESIITTLQYRWLLSSQIDRQQTSQVQHIGAIYRNKYIKFNCLSHVPIKSLPCCMCVCMYLCCIIYTHPTHPYSGAQLHAQQPAIESFAGNRFNCNLIIKFTLYHTNTTDISSQSTMPMNMRYKSFSLTTCR